MASYEINPKPWYPFHVTCSTNRGLYEAQVKGFEAGIDAHIHCFVEGVRKAVALQRQRERESGRREDYPPASHTT